MTVEQDAIREDMFTAWRAGFDWGRSTYFWGRFTASQRNVELLRDDFERWMESRSGTPSAAPPLSPDPDSDPSVG